MQQSVAKIVISVIFISLILNSSVVEIAFSQPTTTTYKAISSYGEISPSSSPANDETNGIWCQAGSDITLSQSQFY